MGSTTFSGPVTSTAGFITGTGIVATSVTAASLTVTSSYSGQIIPLNRAAGQAVTLPASTGSQAVYEFYVGTAITSNSTTISVANGTDVMNGFATVGGATSALFGTLPASDRITMNGSTQGGLAGSWVRVRDIAAGFWQVEAALVGSGTPITVFSAAV